MKFILSILFFFIVFNSTGQQIESAELRNLLILKFDNISLINSTGHLNDKNIKPELSVLPSNVKSPEKRPLFCELEYQLGKALNKRFKFGVESENKELMKD